MKTILVVDDEEDIRETLKVLLEKNNYKTILAVDGQDCLDKLDKLLPDLVLLDIMMPGISGWEVASTIKSNSKTKHIPVVFLTGKADDLSRSMGLNGAEDYIAKPFDPFMLLEHIKKWV